jgi:hypothetical protein
VLVSEVGARKWHNLKKVQWLYSSRQSNNLY